MEENSLEQLKQTFLEGKKNLLREFEERENGPKEGEGLTQEIINKMLLPDGCYLVEREKTDISVLVIGVEPVKQDYGKIVLAADDISEYLGDTVYFKPSHAEEIEINNKTYIYLTNFKHSIFYILTEK